MTAPAAFTRVDSSSIQRTENAVETPVAKPGQRGTVLVFNGELLPPSQTFIRDHVENIRAFDTLLLGVRRVPGLDIDHLSTAMVPDARFARPVLWLLGRSSFLDRLVREHNVVAIHAHFAGSGRRIARFAERRKLPLFVTLHGADVLRDTEQGLLTRLRRSFLRRRMFRHATMFLAVSNYIREAAVRSGYPTDRLRKHELGIPLDRFENPPSRRNRQTPRILFVGRMVEKKGLSYLLDACQQLAAERIDFTLDIIGDGPLAPRHRE
jgi:colanic acid/amylovoran biosynthesis glycosyltransferase